MKSWFYSVCTCSESDIHTFLISVTRAQVKQTAIHSYIIARTYLQTKNSQTKAVSLMPFWSKHAHITSIQSHTTRVYMSPDGFTTRKTQTTQTLTSVYMN